MMLFDGTVLWFTGSYHEMLISGLLLSLKLLLLSLAFALPLSLGIALLRLSSICFLRALGWFYVESMRNVPLLAHLLFWYFGAPELLPQSCSEWLYGHNFETIAAVIALALYTAAYMSEDVRSGVRAISLVQFEAGRALGLSFLATMRLIVLPQALRATLPPLVSQTINLWKDTSLATVIGTAELMYQAARVEAASFRYFEPFAFATLSYVAVSLLITGVGVLYQHSYPLKLR